MFPLKNLARKGLIGQQYSQLIDVSFQYRVWALEPGNNIFSVTGPLYREFTGQQWIPSQRPVTRSFDVFFDLRLNQ